MRSKDGLRIIKFSLGARIGVLSAKQRGDKLVRLEFSQNIYKDKGVWYVDEG